MKEISYINDYRDQNAFREWVKNKTPGVYNDAMNYYQLLNEAVKQTHENIEEINDSLSDFAVAYSYEYETDGMTCDKTAKEIYEAYESGKRINVALNDALKLAIGAISKPSATTYIATMYGITLASGIGAIMWITHVYDSANEETTITMASVPLLTEQQITGVVNTQLNAKNLVCEYVADGNGYTCNNLNTVKARIQTAQNIYAHTPFGNCLVSGVGIYGASEGHESGDIEIEFVGCGYDGSAEKFVAYTLTHAIPVTGSDTVTVTKIYLAEETP